MEIKLYTRLGSKNKFTVLDGLYIDLYKIMNLHKYFNQEIYIITGGNLDVLMTAGTDLAIKNFFLENNIDIQNDILTRFHKMELSNIYEISYVINNCKYNILYIPMVKHPIYSSSLEIVHNSYINIFNFINNIEDKKSTIYIPMLGTGFGRLKFEDVEKIYLKTIGD